MSAAPQPSVALPFSASARAGYGFGGDNGVGFHSTGPVRLENPDETEFKRDARETEPTLPTEVVLPHPKYAESPFTRYVTRPLSNGTLSADLKNFAPEDRSRMGVPLNPFWIRNDLWSIQNEANIFMDAGPNWVHRRLKVSGGQDAQQKRDAYLDNEEQPQYGKGSTLSADLAPAPSAPAAGNVTGTEAAEAASQTLALDGSNPAQIKNDQADELPKSLDVSAAPKTATDKDQTTAVEGETEAVKPPKKKRAKRGEKQ